MKNVTDFYAHAQPVDTRRSSPIFQAPRYEASWTEAYALPNKEAATVARVLVNEWICRFGVPDAIHSDQGANFEGHLFMEVGELLGIEKTRTKPYHPQLDDLVERMN